MRRDARGLAAGVLALALSGRTDLAARPPGAGSVPVSIAVALEAGDAAPASAPGAAAAPQVVARIAPPLAIRCHPPLLGGGRFTLELVQGPALAKARLHAFVFLDGNLIGATDTNGGRTWVELDAGKVSPGAHRLLVNANGIRLEAECRFASRAERLGEAAGALALLAVAGWGIARKARGRGRDRARF